jgi:hypothetical protein
VDYAAILEQLGVEDIDDSSEEDFGEGDDLVSSDGEVVVVEATTKKPKCPYGEECYRKNPEHFKEFSH